MSANEGRVRRRRHPGSGRGRGARKPKGRQVEPRAQDEIRALLGERPRRRDLLIEYLHLVQDRYGCLSAAHLAALAEEMRVSMSEVYETATFYAHFDVVDEDARIARAAHGPGLRQPDLRADGRRRSPAGARSACRRGVSGAAGSLHGSLPHRSDRGGRSSPRRPRERRYGARRHRRGQGASGDSALSRLRCVLRGRRRLRPPACLYRGRAARRRRDRDSRSVGVAGLRRRRLSHRVGSGRSCAATPVPASWR